MQPSQDIFDQIIDRTVAKEGGYSDHPSDRGGKTIWGVTEETARRYGYTGAMRDMPRSVALAIYRTRYVVAPGFDKVATRSAPIAEELFDTGVNMGQGVPVIFLQRALNAFNRQGVDYADVKVDADIGPATLRALDAFLAKRGVAGVEVMLKALNCLQGARYIELAEGRAANEDFAYGWINNRIELS